MSMKVLPCHLFNGYIIPSPTDASPYFQLIPWQKIANNSKLSSNVINIVANSLFYESRAPLIIPILLYFNRHLPWFVNMRRLGWCDSLLIFLAESRFQGVWAGLGSFISISSLGVLICFYFFPPALSLECCQ